MKKIVVLNGAYRKNGSTAALVEAFRKGALEAGNSVTVFRLDGMEIGACTGCLSASRDIGSPCRLKDDMDLVYRAFGECGVVVFASPLYFWTITGTLKRAADRLYAALECLGYGGFERESVLLMSADGNDYSQALTWYRTYERNLGWRSLGEVLGKGKTEEAYRLGLSI